MSFLNFETISGALKEVAASFSRWGMNIKYGVNYNITATFTGTSQTKGERNGALFSNHVTALGYIKCEEVIDQPVYDGFNNVMLGEDGLPDYDLMANAITKLYNTEREGGNARAILASSIKEDNTTMILYNMLRLYAIKKLQKTEKCRVKPDDVIYDDGHVQVLATDFLGITSQYDIKDFNLMMPRDIDASTLLQRGMMIEDGDMLMLNIDGMTSKDQTVIQLAAMEWPDQDLPFRVCHPSFQAATTMVMHDQQAKIKPVTTLDQIGANDVLGAIIKFVTNMRVYAHFDMAYALYAQTLYTHLPRSAEAFIWYGKRSTMALCRSRSPRGIHPLMTAGQPYVTDVSRWATYKSFVNYPDRAIIHSIALSEAVMTSTFDYLTRAKDVTDPLKGVVGVFYAYETGLLRELMLASMRFGLPMDMPWPSEMGLKRYNWLDTVGRTKYLNVRVIDMLAPQTYNIVKKHINGEDRDLLRLIELVPACYPVLSMGIKASKFYMNELVQEVSLRNSGNANRLFTTDVYEAHRAMSIWRVMGWDVSVQRLRDGAFFANWAPNANGHYVPAFMDDQELVQSYEFPAELLRKRGHNWIDMPDVNEELNMRIEMKYLMHKIFVDNIDARAFGSAVAPKPMNPEEASGEVLGINVRYTKHEIMGIDSIQKMSDFRKAWDSSLTVADAEVFTGHTT